MLFQRPYARRQLDHTQPDGVGTSVTARYQAAQAPHEPVGADAQEQAHLVEGRPIVGGAIRGQMGFSGLDVVFRPAARAVDVLIDGPARPTAQTGDDKAGLYPLQSGFKLGDDALRPVPASCRVVEYL